MVRSPTEAAATSCAAAVASVLLLVVAGVAAAEPPVPAESISFTADATAVFGSPHYVQPAIVAMARDPRSTRLAVARHDGSVLLVECDSGKIREIRESSSGSEAMAALAFSPDGGLLAAGSVDGTLCLWDTATEQLLQTAPSASWIGALAFSPSGDWLASGGYDRHVHLWDPTNLVVRQTFAGHAAAVRAVAFSRDGTLLASGGVDRTLRFWDVASGASLATCPGHTGAIRAAAFSPDGATLATVSEDTTVRLWDSNTYKPIQTLDGHRAMAWCLAFSPGGQNLATASIGDQVVLWNARTGAQRQRLKGHPGGVAALAFAPDGRRLFSAGHDGTVRLWQGEEPPDYPKYTLSQAALAAVLSPPGDLLACALEDSRIVVVNTSTTSIAVTLALGAANCTVLGFSFAGDYLAAGCDDGQIQLWRISDGIRLSRWEAHQAKRHVKAIQAIAFSPDGTKLASGGLDGTIYMWDLSQPDRPRLLFATERESLPITSLQFAPGGRRLASSTGSWKNWRSPGSVKFWDVATGEAQNTLGAHSAEVAGVRFSQDGKRLATFGSFYRVRLWNAESGSDFAALAEQTTVRAAEFLRGGLMAVATTDGELWLWNALRYRRLKQLAGHEQPVVSLSASEDGSRLATVSSDGVVKLWDIPEPPKREILLRP